MDPVLLPKPGVSPPEAYLQVADSVWGTVGMEDAVGLGTPGRAVNGRLRGVGRGPLSGF